MTMDAGVPRASKYTQIAAAVSSYWFGGFGGIYV